MLKGYAKRWRKILRRTYEEYRDDQVSIVASGVAFRVVLAVFPGIALLVWIGMHVLGAGAVHTLLGALTSNVPDNGRTVITQAIQSSMAHNPVDHSQHGHWGAAGPIVGIAFMIYSTNNGMQALFSALNVIYDMEERRSFVRFTAITLAFTLGTLTLLVVLTALVAVVPRLLAYLGISGAALIGLTVLRWPVSFAAVAFALALLYRFAPHRDREPWPLVTIGSVVAAFLVVLLTALFSWVMGRFASLTVTYGSLSTVIAFMLWLWASFWIILICAEFDSCIQSEADHSQDRPDQ